jgi:hypothetical protein
MTQDEIIAAIQASSIQPTVQPAIIAWVKMLFASNPNANVTFCNVPIGLGSQLVVVGATVTATLSFYTNMPGT